MAEKTLKEHLTLSISIILVGGLCLGWVGGRAIDYTFKDVRDNTMFRVSQTEENKHLNEEIEELKEALSVLPKMSETLVRIDERIRNWEPSE
jgi:hypothetical protein